MSELPENLGATVKKLPPVAWVGVVVTGAGIGLYLRHRNAGKIVTNDPGTASATNDTTGTYDGYQGAGNLGVGSSDGGSAGNSDTAADNTTPLSSSVGGINLPVVAYAVHDPINGQTALYNGSGFTALLDDPAVVAQRQALQAQNDAVSAQLTSSQSQVAALQTAAKAPPTPVAEAFPGIEIQIHTGDTYKAITNFLASKGIVVTPDQVRGLSNGTSATLAPAGKTFTVDGSRFKQNTTGQWVFQS